MGSLARKIQQEQRQRKIQSQQAHRPRKFGLTPGEIVIGIAFSAILCFGGVQIISNQAEIYEMNKSVQKTTAMIENQQKVNTDLKKQVEELSTYDRILAKAKELGLKLNENNVKVVQQ